jgi:uncharacterized protein YmfQ (DUF2313 family)
MAFEDIYASTTTTIMPEGYYDEVNEVYAEVLKALLPTGVIWDFREGSNAYLLLRALSYNFSRVAIRAQQLLLEAHPDTMMELLPDWERVLGLPGSNPSPPTALAERRAAVRARLTEQDDPTPSFFVGLANDLGYDKAYLAHKLYDTFVAGSSAGDPLWGDDWAFWWTLEVVADASDALLDWTVSRNVPEHTNHDVIYKSYYTWYEQANPANVRLDGVYHDGVQYVAVGASDGSDPYVITSTDGELWTEQSCPGTTADLKQVHGSGSLWVAVGAPIGGASLIVTSIGAVSWTLRSNPSTGTLQAVWYGNGLWVAVGEFGTVMTSPDGITWTTRTQPLGSITYNCVAYGNGLWVAINAGNKIITSPDGITWTARSEGSTTGVQGVLYANSLWIAVGNNADGTPYIITSTDGITWTRTTSVPAKAIGNGLAELAYSSLMGKWVTVGPTDGVDANIFQSDDGLTWTESPNAKSVSLNSVAHGATTPGTVVGHAIAVGVADGVDAYMVRSQ